MKPMWWGFRGKKEREPLQYAACGLADVWLVSGYTTVETRYGTGIVVTEAENLHRCIGRYLARLPRALSATELRYLRVSMDAAPVGLAGLLHIPEPHISHWEDGLTGPEGPAEILLRAFYLQFAGERVDLEALSLTRAGLPATRPARGYFRAHDNWLPLAER